MNRRVQFSCERPKTKAAKVAISVNNKYIIIIVDNNSQLGVGLAQISLA